MSTPYLGKLEIQNVSFVSLMPTKENQIEFSKPSSFSETIAFEKQKDINKENELINKFKTEFKK